MSSFDWARSVLRSAGEETWRALFTTEWARRVRRSLADLRDWTVRVDAARLTSALARAEGVQALTATTREGALRVDATLEDGSVLRFSLRVASIRFAGGGAKEIVFMVDPAEARERAATLALVSCLSGLIARLLWGRVLGPAGWEGVVPSRHEDAGLRVDLRETARARQLMRQGPRASLLDVLEVAEIELKRGSLALRLRPPAFLSR